MDSDHSIIGIMDIFLSRIEDHRAAKSLKRPSVLRVEYDVKRKKIHLKHKLRQEWGRNKRTCSSALEQRQN